MLSSTGGHKESNHPTVSRGSLQSSTWPSHQHWLMEEGNNERNYRIEKLFVFVVNVRTDRRMETRDGLCLALRKRLLSV